jgi:hypothetical protein
MVDEVMAVVLKAFKQMDDEQSVKPAAPTFLSRSTRS